jgi:hypothetical protein
MPRGTEDTHSLVEDLSAIRLFVGRRLAGAVELGKPLVPAGAAEMGQQQLRGRDRNADPGKQVSLQVDLSYPLGSTL